MNRGEEFCDAQVMARYASDVAAGKLRRDSSEEMPTFMLPEEEAADAVQSGRNPKDVAGSRKPPLHLVPPVGIIYTAKVMEAGRDEYGEANWRTGPKIGYSNYMDAIDRHYLALLDGEWLDRKTGLPHLAHIAATCFIMLDADELGQMEHDGPTSGKAADLIEKFTKPLEDPTEIE